MNPDTSHGAHDAGHGAAHGTLKSYVIGFFLSVLLTLASFAIAMKGGLAHDVALRAIVGLCVVQLVVQLFYFLHIGFAPGQRSNTAIFICTASLIAIIVGGSLWVMHNANVNMMPTPITAERALSRD
jgi:cytochrome o ubiquinol oxidase operon protein cyoD